MATKSKQFILDMEQVRRPLEVWRRTRKHRQSIPEALWTAMARVAKTYGVSPVSHALGVEYYGLKRRVKEGPSTHVSVPNQPAFVELRTLPPCGEAGCTVELENRSGARMTLRLNPSSGVDALALVKAFWRRGA
jgi:hypothetical protein